MAKRLSAGTGIVGISRSILATAGLPLGSIRRSGYGRELVDLGIKEFVNLPPHQQKSVTPIDFSETSVAFTATETEAA